MYDGHKFARMIWWALAVTIYVVLFSAILAGVALGSVWKF